MDQNLYEALFIFESNRFARDREALPKEVEGMIAEGGGEVLISRLWEERKLAYPINGHRKGTYWLVYFRGKPGQITPLNRQCQIHDGVLRQLVLKIHPHLEEAILSHASGAGEEPADEAESETAEVVETASVS
jgi:small subunit ribosomal protein S6